MNRLLICTDLDRTLIPNGPHPESPGAAAILEKLLQHPACRLAFVSGRSLEKVQSAIRQFSLPLPQAIISDVGAGLWLTDAQQTWQPDKTWQQALSTHWPSSQHGRLLALARQHDWLEAQPNDCQKAFKASFFVSRQAPEDWSQQLWQKLPGAEHCRMIISDDGDHVLLDLLPANASKYHAICRLLAHWQWGKQECVFCGDSGNDLEALCSDLPGVLVNNATQAIKQQALTQVRTQKQMSTLFLARGDFHGLNGNYAAGILEGVAHFYPHTLSWMGLSDS